MGQSSFLLFKTNNSMWKLSPSLCCIVQVARNSDRDMKGTGRPHKKWCFWKNNLLTTYPAWFELTEGPRITPVDEKMAGKGKKYQGTVEKPREQDSMSQIFSCFHQNGPVWAQNSMNPYFRVPTVKHRRSSVIAWYCMAISAEHNWVNCDGTVKSTSYLDHMHDSCCHPPLHPSTTQEIFSPAAQWKISVSVNRFYPK